MNQTLSIPGTRRLLAAVKVQAQIAHQLRWIEEHGGDRAGYLARYGEAGDGGEAIYEADRAELDRLTEKLANLNRIRRRLGELS